MALTTRFLAAAMLWIAQGVGLAASLDWQSESTRFIRDLDLAQYDTPKGDEQIDAFETLRLRAIEIGKQYPGRAEPMVWEAWALLAQGSVSRSFSSLSLMNDGKARLEAAVASDPKVYNGAAYTWLGMWNLNAPAFFCPSCRQEAQDYLQKALALDPTGIEPNRWYAEVLLENGDYAGAVKYARSALSAPTRPGREKADQDLRAQAERVLAEAVKKQS